MRNITAIERPGDQKESVHGQSELACRTKLDLVGRRVGI